MTVFLISVLVVQAKDIFQKKDKVKCISFIELKDGVLESLDSASKSVVKNMFFNAETVLKTNGFLNVGPEW